MKIELRDENAKILYRLVSNLTPDDVCKLAQEKCISTYKTEKAIDELFDVLDEIFGKEQRMPLNQ